MLYYAPWRTCDVAKSKKIYVDFLFYKMATLEPPKRPRSGYFIFVAENRAILKAENPSMYFKLLPKTLYNFLSISIPT